MESIIVVFKGNASGEVQLFTDGSKVEKMDIVITNERLTVFHTEVDSEFEGQGSQNYC